MAISNHERIGRALEQLRDGLRPNCEASWRGFYGDDWLHVVNQQFRRPLDTPSTNDVSFYLNGLKATWNEVFSHSFGPSDRSLVFNCGETRNRWAHQESFSSDETLRALDEMEQLLQVFGDSDNRAAIKQSRRDLMRQLFEEEARTERRKTAAKATEGQPLAGLAPWRQVITPHEDVASGRFDQAEFAADLFEVANGTADSEYQDPQAFFARTYLTGGLQDLIEGAVRRLSGGGGDPVIELQTNFGGGKTHSMIALYHLASGVDVAELPGVAELLQEKGLTLPGRISRAALVGQMISPAAPEKVEDGVQLNTLWGRLAYQLGGREAYELVRLDDEQGTNPGAALRTVFEMCGPAVVLIDEWVAYARQLRDGDEGNRLCGGDFDTQFTFAQALTEAAAAVPNVVLLVSIPSSDIEVGGDRGKTALEKLKNVVTRKAAQWQPASPDESFEIVRRRLFNPMDSEAARVRDGVIRAFIEMYRENSGMFPSGVSEADYRRRMELSYPIHPELFDRLFEEWSALDKFQRTRGVLRLMAIAISQLWQRNDQALLIMSGNLPMDSGALASEMKKYLEDGWDPVIKSDVDGENSLPLRLDQEVTHFGAISACRRAARAVYMGSAPFADQTKGVDVKRVTLAAAQPGEPIRQFEDALKRLSDRATHLYVNGAQYRFSLQPNATRLAADRAESNFTDFDADEEIRRRLSNQSRRGAFEAIHIFAEGPGDVPDDDSGVRLVVLSPQVSHSRGDNHSSAIELAQNILLQRESGPRLHRNMLVFVAAAANRLSELRRATRLYLAWQSILEDRVSLDLTEQNKNLATTQQDKTSQQIDAFIGETFTLALTPKQTPGTNEIKWETTTASTTGDLAERVSTKLASEEKLIGAYGGIRVRMDLDKYGLWTDRHDVQIADLWSTYARFPYMPRLASVEVLKEAVVSGVGEINWAQETFAYAEGHNGENWVGVRTAMLVSPTMSGFLIEPAYVPEVEPPVPGVGSDEGAAIESGGEDGSHAPQSGFSGVGRQSDGLAASEEVSGEPPKTEFYALFNLDAVRAIKELSQILDNVTPRLGAGVQLHLEVRAVSDDGFDDTTQRIVSENATSLGAKAIEFG